MRWLIKNRVPRTANKLRDGVPPLSPSGKGGRRGGYGWGGIAGVGGLVCFALFKSAYTIVERKDGNALAVLGYPSVGSSAEGGGSCRTVRGRPPMKQRLSADLLAMPRGQLCEIFAKMGFYVDLAKQKRAGIPSCKRSNSTGVAMLTDRLIVFHVRRRKAWSKRLPGRAVNEMRARKLRAASDMRAASPPTAGVRLSPSWKKDRA